jgi:hypothetical protein
MSVFARSTPRCTHLDQNNDVTPSTEGRAPPRAVLPAGEDGIWCYVDEVVMELR